LVDFHQKPIWCEIKSTHCYSPRHSIIVGTHVEPSQLWTSQHDSSTYQQTTYLLQYTKCQAYQPLNVILLKHPESKACAEIGGLMENNSFFENFNCRIL
jgi:hypothetical protein